MAYKESLKNRWAHMRERCLDPKHKHFKEFGGKGIGIHPSWTIYENFRKWSLENGYQEGLNLGRKDTNADYGPDNCVYVTDEKQANNRNNNRFMTYKGVTDTLINLCRIFDKNYNSVRNKVHKGASIEYAMESTDKCFVIPDHSDPAKIKKARAAKTERRLSGSSI